MTRQSVIPPPSTREILQQLEALTSALMTEVSVQGVLQRVVDVCGEVIGARQVAIVIFGPDRNVVQSLTTRGIDPGLEAHLSSAPGEQGVRDLALRDTTPVRLPDRARHPDSGGFPRHAPPMHSLLGVAVVGSLGIVGNLYLVDKAGSEPFTKEDEEVAILIAKTTAAALENARHHEESARLLEEVQQLHRARERFFAMVNHELRNALAAVYGWSEMLVRKRDPATVPRAAFEVLDSAQQAVALIDDLLDLSRLDENRLKPSIRPVDPLLIATRAVRRVTPAADLKRVAVQVDAGPDLPTCETDANRAEQILINLLSNAIKYAPAQSEVRVGIERRGAHIVYQIEDDGPGVAGSDVEQVFDVYVTKAGEESRGLGLGLPLSRRLARLLRGELYAVARPGKGGCFVLEVPATPS
jgi:signal transduction histidine kinase